MIPFPFSYRTFAFLESHSLRESTRGRTRTPTKRNSAAHVTPSICFLPTWRRCKNGRYGLTFLCCCGFFLFDPVAREIISAAVRVSRVCTAVTRPRTADSGVTGKPSPCALKTTPCLLASAASPGRCAPTCLALRAA